jgi:hypothetical protein
MSNNGFLKRLEQLAQSINVKRACHIILGEIKGRPGHKSSKSGSRKGR